VYALIYKPSILKIFNEASSPLPQLLKYTKDVVVHIINSILPLGKNATLNKKITFWFPKIEEELRDDRATRITQKELQGLFNELLLGYDHNAMDNCDDIIQELFDDKDEQGKRYCNIT